MPKYRKKPVVIEARRLTMTNRGELRIWAGAELSEFGDAWSLVIHTLEGDHRANAGDWIIQGIKGEFYPCRDDIFDATYEEVVE